MRCAAFVLTTLLAGAGLPVQAADRRPITVDDLFRCPRLSDPQISPDGTRVAYVVTTVDLEANRSASSIWLALTDGKGQPTPLTNTPGKKDTHPRWSPDGKRLLFESNRSGNSQLWVIDVGGGEARQLTTLSTGATNAVWSPDSRYIAFVSAVWPEYSAKPFAESAAANKKRTEEMDRNPVKARVFTWLFARHWDSYVEDKRQHLFVLSFHDGQVGEPKDVTPGDRDAFPTSDTFATGDNFTFSPDGTFLLFTAPPAKDEAWNTNYDIFRVPVTGGTTEWESLTRDNPAADSGPRFSPDGKKLAYRAQKKPGYEADRWDIQVVACEPSGTFRGKPKTVASQSDLSVNEFVWYGRDQFACTADDKGYIRVFFAAETGGKGWHSGQDPRPHGVVTALSTAFDQNRDKRPKVAFLGSAMNQPAEVYCGWNAATNLSRANDAFLAHLELPRPDSVTIKGAGGTPMQMWLLKPPGFNPKKKWPLVYLVHGGPQGAWEDRWHYRWNPQLWAAQGYVVALPNPRGSTGFGQKYVEEISGDWGGKCFEDLMKGVDYLEKLPFIDRNRMAAAGASFGGYMINWFAVNTGRFKTLISHAGVWNFESAYGTTDELWFDEYEHGGSPWGPNRASYEKYSPHRLAANLGRFKTPMLLIQNDLDFRCPVGQGIELFTALQRQGVPSRFINFPDEGHWVTKPRNSQFWHQEVFSWLSKRVTPGGR
jgi:dipeptidyl aminopeptidase/acylaminoacyl peptidase